MMRMHKGRTNDKKQNDTILKTKTNVTNYLERNKIMLTAAPRPATIKINVILTSSVGKIDM